MSPLNSEKIEQMTKAHYKLQTGCYLKGTSDLGGAIYSIGKYISDCCWNYDSLVRTTSDQVGNLIAKVDEFSKSNGRKSAFYLDPSTQPPDFSELVQKAGFALEAQEIWMIHNKKDDLKNIVESPDVKIDVLKTSDQMTEYVKVFNDGFGMSSDAYGVSLQDAFRNPSGSVEIIHYLAYFNGKVCGVASLYSAGSVGGIYNVTTLSEYRGHGIGTALNKRAVLDSLNRKHELLILQTEENSAAYRIYERMGFQPGFSASIYLKG